MSRWWLPTLGLCLLARPLCAAEAPSWPELARGLQASADASAEWLAEHIDSACESLWSGRPQWCGMLVSLLRGEEPRLGTGWFAPAEDTRDWQWMRVRFDRDGNGKIHREELGPAARHFDPLDGDRGGWIEASDLASPSDALADELGADLAAALFGALDADRNARVSWDELSWFFQRGDRRKRGFLTREDLSQLVAGSSGRDSRNAQRRRESVSRWLHLRRFFRGELGSFREGPALGAPAPDFELSPMREGKRVRLSDSREKKAVVLIFGSFT